MVDIQPNQIKTSDYISLQNSGEKVEGICVAMTRENHCFRVFV